MNICGQSTIMHWNTFLELNKIIKSKIDASYQNFNKILIGFFQMLKTIYHFENIKDLESQISSTDYEIVAHIMNCCSIFYSSENLKSFNIKETEDVPVIIKDLISKKHRKNEDKSKTEDLHLLKSFTDYNHSKVEKHVSNESYDDVVKNLTTNGSQSTYKETKEIQEKPSSVREALTNIYQSKSKVFFQVVYVFKNKKKRMYRIDCMTRKINVNYYKYVKDNQKSLALSSDFVKGIKNIVRFTSRIKFQEINKKFPEFRASFESFIQSQAFKNLILSLKKKYDLEYLKLFFRHSRNFLNFYLKDSSHSKLGRKFGSKNLKTMLGELDED